MKGGNELFYHIYTNRTEVSIEDLVLMAESQLDCSYEGFEIVHVHVSELVKYPSVIKDVEDLIKRGRQESKLVVLQNDYGEPSVKRSLESRIPSLFGLIAREFDKVVKTNMIAV